MSALSKKLAVLFSGLALLPALVWAEVPDRVGRIAYLSGDVQFYSEAAQGWVQAELNAPVSSRNSLLTGPDGRAEVRFGSAAATLDANTQLDIPLLDDGNFKARVSRGSVNFRIPSPDSDESYEITALPGRYQFLQAGRYRVDLEAAGSSVSVFAGRANALFLGQEVSVGAGQSLSAKGSGYSLGVARPTSLDDLAAQRDDVGRARQATRYVSPEMTGYEELDANGRWESDADYGTVWYPTTYVSADWVPYRDGRWAYVAPWGWTWIDAAPWGFAPFHYGRWAKIGSSWAWAPGAYVKRPSYAPALVAFAGGVPGASISIAARPALSWHPLAPRESYRPAYRHTRQHLSNINNFGTQETPPHALQRMERQSVSANQIHGRSEVPHAAFVAPRSPGRGALPAFSSAASPPSGRGQALRATVPEAEPVVPPGKGRSEFSEKRPGQEPWPEPAARWPRSPAEGLGLGTSGAPPLKPAETAPGVTPGSMPSPASPQAGGFRGGFYGRERPAPPVIAPPQKVETAPLSRMEKENKMLENQVLRPAVPPTTQPASPEISPGASRRQENWPRGGAPAATVESRPESPQNRFGASHFGNRPEMPHPTPSEFGAARMRAEPPATRSEPRNNTPEPQRELKRDPEKERSSGPERGRQGESRGRDPAPH
jgi:hypothetical protein